MAMFGELHLRDTKTLRYVGSVHSGMSKGALAWGEDMYPSGGINVEPTESLKLYGALTTK